MRYQLPRGYRRYLLGLAMLASGAKTTAAGAILVKR